MNPTNFTLALTVGSVTLQRLGDRIAFGPPDVQDGAGGAQLLGQPGYRPVAATGVHQGELHRRAARVEDQDAGGAGHTGLRAGIGHGKHRPFGSGKALVFRGDHARRMTG